MNWQKDTWNLHIYWTWEPLTCQHPNSFTLKYHKHLTTDLLLQSTIQTMLLTLVHKTSFYLIIFITCQYEAWSRPTNKRTTSVRRTRYKSWKSLTILERLFSVSNFAQKRQKAIPSSTLHSGMHYIIAWVKREIFTRSSPQVSPS